MSLFNCGLVKNGEKNICQVTNEVCDTTAADFDVFILSNEQMDDATECSNQCEAESNLGEGKKPCLGYNLRTLRGHSECLLLRSPCVRR